MSTQTLREFAGGLAFVVTFCAVMFVEGEVFEMMIHLPVAIIVGLIVNAKLAGTSRSLLQPLGGIHQVRAPTDQLRGS